MTNNRHIRITTVGEIIISDELRELFPEIVVTLQGDKIIVDNAWDKQGLQVITDTTFYAETTEYLAYDILFTDNVGHITQVENLAVRYLNKYSDLELSSPIGKSSLLKLLDPLNKGSYIQYGSILQPYIDGSISLAKFSQTLGEQLSSLYDLDTATVVQEVANVFDSITTDELTDFVTKDIGIQQVIDAICMETTDGTYDVFASTQEEMFEAKVVDGELTKLVIDTDKTINMDCLRSIAPTINREYADDEYFTDRHVSDELIPVDYADDGYFTDGHISNRVPIYLDYADDGYSDTYIAKENLEE